MMCTLFLHAMYMQLAPSKGPLPLITTRLTVIGNAVVLLWPQADFRKAKEKVLYKKKEGVPEGLYM